MSEGLGHKRVAKRRDENPVVARRGLPAVIASGAAAPIASRPEERVRARSLNPGLTAVVAVTGAASNAGKTWLCERIIEGLVRAGARPVALKVTRTHEASCPRENDACGVCDGLDALFRVIRDRDSLDVRGKDTGRYLAAGAAEVLWLVVQPGAVRAGLAAVLPAFPPGAILVAEGNSFRDFADPDLTLMALSERSDPKPSALTVLDRVDAFAGTEAAVALLRRHHAAALAGRPVLAPPEAAGWTLGRLGF